MRLEQFLPAYDFNEVHAIVVRATPSRIFDAIKRVTPEEMPLVRTLFALRALPVRLAGRAGVRVAGGRAILDQALSEGFVLLAEVPDEELVLGVVGQFWSLRGGASPVLSSLADFAAFETPGYAKAAMNFRLEPLGAGRVRVTTETRIRALDPDARKRFARYWRLVHPGSALIRRIWLRAIKGHAERP